MTPLPVTIATVILDPPTALLFGCAIALVSAKLISQRPQQEIGKTAALGAAWAVFYGFCVGWFFFKEPDWMLVYLKDAREVPLPFAYVVFLFVLAAHGALGALANAALLQRGYRGLAWLLTIGAIVTLGGAMWLQAKQYAVVGTYEQYYAGIAPALVSHPTMKVAMNVSGALSTVGAIVLFVWRYLQARRAILQGAAGGSAS